MRLNIRTQGTVNIGPFSYGCSFPRVASVGAVRGEWRLSDILIRALLLICCVTSSRLPVSGLHFSHMENCGFAGRGVRPYGLITTRHLGT